MNLPLGVTNSWRHCRAPTGKRAQYILHCEQTAFLKKGEWGQLLMLPPCTESHRSGTKEKLVICSAGQKEKLIGPTRKRIWNSFDCVSQ